MESQEQRKLRAALRAHERGRGKRFPAELKARAFELVVQRRRAGLSYGAIGAELGLPLETVRRWWLSANGSKPKRTRMVPVEIVPTGSPMLSVSSPSGYRVDGLTFEQAVALLRELR